MMESLNEWMEKLRLIFIIILLSYFVLFCNKEDGEMYTVLYL